MKPLTAAALGLVVGISAMWIGGDRLKALVQGGGACCPSHHDGGAVPDTAGAVSGASCPAHYADGDLVVDDRARLQRVRIALRDGIFTPWTELGRAPTKAEFATRLKLDDKRTIELLDTLESCGESIGGGILRAPQSDLIATAWPFSNLPTGIDVTIEGGKTVHARCAVDSLGVAEMMGKRATVDAEATDDHTKIHIVVDGTTVVEATPRDLVVYKGGSCDEMLFFSSPAAVEGWKKRNGVTGGELMSLADGVKHGAELFGRITKGLPSPDEAAKYMASAGEASPHVAPWEPVDEAFRGCEGGCGARAESAEEGVVVQATTPAKLGDKVYCPVSGVVFTVSEQSAHRDIDGKTVYFCCEACAQYFAANQARVAQARGFGART